MKVYLDMCQVKLPDCRMAVLRTYTFSKCVPIAAGLEDQHRMVGIFRQTSTEHQASQASANNYKVVLIVNVLHDNIARGILVSLW